MPSDLLLLFVGIVGYVVGHLFGWMSGRNSGKVAAIEAAHGIDLSGGDDDE